MVHSAGSSEAGDAGPLGGSGSSVGSPSLAQSGATGAPQKAVPKPRVEMGQWDLACPSTPASDGWVRDIKVDSKGTAFFSEFGGGANAAPSGSVEMCSPYVEISPIAFATSQLYPIGPTLLSDARHLLMASVQPTGDFSTPATVLEWTDGGLLPYNAAPRSDSVLLAENAVGALFSIYPNEDSGQVRQYSDSVWVPYTTEPTPWSQHPGSVRSMVASSDGHVYVAYSVAAGTDPVSAIEVKFFDGLHWDFPGDPLTVDDQNPVLRIAPDDTLYLGAIDKHRHKVSVLQLVSGKWQELEPALDVYDTRSSAHLELDGQGRPLVVADDLEAGTSSVFVRRDGGWVQLGAQPLADKAGCSYSCPLIAVSPSGTLFGLGTLAGFPQLSRYLAP